jgi:GNAT superfamily N-acetyltransferase
MDRDRVREIQRRAMADWIAMMASASPGGRVFEADGITGAAAPACPDRSVANSVVYADDTALLDSLERLAGFYEEAAIEAWTVWVPEFETETIAALEAAGHAFDGSPAAMVLELEGWEPPELGDLDWDDRAEPGVAGRLNDLAYGLKPENGLARALQTRPEPYRLYQARIEGEPVCVVGTIDHGGEDLGFYFVATHPDHQGKGLTTRLMSVAIADAKERGLATSSLQASAMGEPVYRRLGFQPYFRFHMYERRRPGSEPVSHPH